MAEFKENGNWGRMFHSPGGMVGRHLKAEARKVAALAKPKVGTKYATGKLASSIKPSAVTKVPAGLSVDIVAHSDHAYYHHEGIRPFSHTMPTGEVMVFPSRGTVVITTEIDHPGHSGNPFLWDALVEVVGGSVVVPHRSKT